MSTRASGKRLQHQRFPVHAIENTARFRGSGQASNRVAVNFIPTTHLTDLAGSAVTATLTHVGLGDQFRLVFFRDDEQLFLSTPGAGQLFANCDVRDLAGRLQRVLVAMTADPAGGCRRWMCSVTAEQARLDEVGQPGGVDRADGVRGVDSGVVRRAGGARRRRRWR